MSFFFGAATWAGGGPVATVGNALRSEGVLSGKGLREILSGKGVRDELSGSGLRTFGGGVGAAELAVMTAAGTAVPFMVPLDRVDEGLGVMEDLSGPGDCR